MQFVQLNTTKGLPNQNAMYNVKKTFKFPKSTAAFGGLSHLHLYMQTKTTAITNVVVSHPKLQIGKFVSF
jgi:hypothetical protein